MKRIVCATAAVLALAPAAAEAVTLSAPTARQAALAAERANARSVARKSPRLSPASSHVDSCRRVSAKVIRCATHSTFEYHAGESAGEVLVDKVMTRAIVTVRLHRGRLVVRHRSR